MDFKILHLSSVRARVRADFRLTPDVKVYFKKQAAKIENIQKVDFYQDEYTFVLFSTVYWMKVGHKWCVRHGSEVNKKWAYLPRAAHTALIISVYPC